MRTIRILKVGESNGRPYVRGVTDFEPNEMLSAMQIASANGAKAPTAAFGLVNGIADEDARKLTAGTVLAASELNVRCRPDSYKTESGDVVPSVDCRITLAGEVSVSPAPTAKFRW